eukprot:gnl/TRDRNA2_/TRDRNA2_130696_c0_seq2.p1 gnl/TRDRNA2_/TRDRNA2_130696_c0~~gnl/TRDRNA2_/TRDRNA2_130696_c0_seq2.p1  ORF type:complete len:191 (-),score=26.83 gnl/TRDRNA2_/TRDRNA2_130696_c0_seq2:36-608(-)
MCDHLPKLVTCFLALAAAVPTTARATGTMLRHGRELDSVQVQARANESTPVPQPTLLSLTLEERIKSRVHDSVVARALSLSRGETDMMIMMIAGIVSVVGTMVAAYVGRAASFEDRLDSYDDREAPFCCCRVGVATAIFLFIMAMCLPFTVGVGWVIALSLMMGVVACVFGGLGRRKYYPRHPDAWAGPW